MDREKAVERCKDCKYCHPFKDWENCQYLACQVCANKWIVEVEECPINYKKDILELIEKVENVRKFKE